MAKQDKGPRDLVVDALVAYYIKEINKPPKSWEAPNRPTFHARINKIVRHPKCPDWIKQDWFMRNE